MTDIVLEPIYEKIPVNEYREPKTIINDIEEKPIVPNKLDPTLSYLFNKNGCSFATIFIAFFWCWMIPMCVLVLSACMNYPAQACDPSRMPFMVSSLTIMLFFSIIDIIFTRISSCDNSFDIFVLMVRTFSSASPILLIILIIVNEFDVYEYGMKLKEGLRFTNGIVMILLLVTLCFYIIKEIIMISTWIQIKKNHK